MPQKASLVSILVLLAVGCGDKVATPTLTGGVWVAKREPSVQKIVTIPHGYQHRYETIDQYRNWLHQQVGNTRFEFFPDGTAKCGGGWFNSDRLVWRTDGPGRYWVMTKYTSWPGIFVVGHGITLNADGTATCEFQVDYSEGTATRIPLTMRKQSTQ
jgi:hypothetical protein